MEDDRYNKMWLKLSNTIKEVAHKCEPYFYAEICETIDNIYNNPLTQEQSYNAYKCWRELKVKKNGKHLNCNSLYMYLYLILFFLHDVQFMLWTKDLCKQ